MKVKLLPAVIAVCSLFSTSIVLANNYRAEINVTYGELELDNSSSDINNMVLTGTYYFSPVDTTNRPLAEAAFLQKANNIYVTGLYGQYKENDSGFDSREENTSYRREIGGDFYIPDSIFYIGAGVYEDKTRYEQKSDQASYRQTIKGDSTWLLRAGITPVDGLLVWSEFEEDIDVSDSWNINAKYVLPIGASGQWLNVEASYMNTDLHFSGDAQELMLAADYYLDSNLSIGGGVTHYSYSGNGSSDNENEYFIRARNFFTDNIAANIDYADNDFGSSWQVGATIRF